MDRFALIASFDRVRGSSLILGIVGVLVGVLLMLAHRTSYDAVVDCEQDRRVQEFETRKFRRRTLVAAMVTSVGCLMVAIYWATEVRVFAVFISLILVLLIGILGVALIDMFSVSLHSIARTDDSERKKVLEDILRKREQDAGNERDDS